MRLRWLSNKIHEDMVFTAALSLYTVRAEEHTNQLETMNIQHRKNQQKCQYSTIHRDFGAQEQ